MLDANTNVGIMEIARGIFSQVPFLRLIGVEIPSASPDRVVASLKSKPELIGNPHQNILHGGVISAVMDSVGGLVAILKFLSTVDQSSGGDEEGLKAIERMTKTATIDMRADYLSPGRGKEFFCDGTILRLGRHVAVCRMEFRNDEGTLIAVGTGTYNY